MTLASRAAAKTLDVPGEPGQTVTIRKLGWKALQDAEQVMQDQALRMLQTRPEDIRRAFEQHGGEAGVRAAVAADPVLKYDAATLIQRSVLSWDSPRAAPADGSELQAWLARQIVMLSNPRLLDEADNASR